MKEIINFLYKMKLIISYHEGENLEIGVKNTQWVRIYNSESKQKYVLYYILILILYSLYY